MTTIERARAEFDTASTAWRQAVEALEGMRVALDLRVRRVFGEDLALIEDAQARLTVLAESERVAWLELQELETLARWLRMVPGTKVHWVQPGGPIPAQVVKSTGKRVQINLGTKGLKWVELDSLVDFAGDPGGHVK